MDAARARRDPAGGERGGIVRPLDDLVVGAAVEADGPAAEHVDRRDHLDPLFEPHGAMLAC